MPDDSRPRFPAKGPGGAAASIKGHPTVPVAAAIFVLCGFVLSVFRPPEVLSRLSRLPDFTLVTQEGRLFTRVDLKEAVALLVPFHTRCLRCLSWVGDTIAAVEDLQRHEPAGKFVRLVFLSLDPEHDVPGVIREYAVRVAPRGGPLFVTGQPEVVREVAGWGLGLYYESSGSGVVRFDERAFLVDPQGFVRREYEGLPVGRGPLARDLRRLVRELEARGPMRWTYELAHQLACYPR